MSHQEQIEAVGNEIDQNNLDLSAHRRRIVHAYAEWIKKGTGEEIYAQVTRLYQITEGLGREKVQELKRETESVAEKSCQYVIEKLTEPALWSPEIDDHDNSDAVRKAQDDRCNVLRRAKGFCGQLLIKYGYEKEGSSYRQAAMGLEYAYGLSTPKEIDQMNSEYRRLVDKAVELNRKRKYLIDESGRDRANSLWQK